MATARYAPGAATGVLSTEVAVLVDLPADHRLVPVLYEAVRGGATVDDLLERLVERGLRDLPNLAIAAIVPAGVRVVVRGTGLAATDAEPRHVRASGVWTDRLVELATGVTLSLGPQPPRPHLPVLAGVVLAGSIGLGTPTPAAGEAAPEAAARPAATPAAQPPQPVTPPDAADPPVPAPPATTRPGPALPPRPGPGPEPTSAPSPATMQLTAWLQTEAELPPAPRLAEPWGLLRWPNGGAVPLTGPTILGRNPRIPDGYAGRPPELLRLHDPGKDISSQHLAISLDSGRVLVTDLGSTNGTRVVPPGRAGFELRPGEPVEIGPGARIILARVIELGFESLR